MDCKCWCCVGKYTNIVISSIAYSNGKSIPCISMVVDNTATVAFVLIKEK